MAKISTESEARNLYKQNKIEGMYKACCRLHSRPSYLPLEGAGGQMENVETKDFSNLAS